MCDEYCVKVRVTEKMFDNLQGGDTFLNMSLQMGLNQVLFFIRNCWVRCWGVEDKEIGKDTPNESHATKGVKHRFPTPSIYHIRRDRKNHDYPNVLPRTDSSNVKCTFVIWDPFPKETV